MTDHIKFALDCIQYWEGIQGTGKRPNKSEFGVFRKNKIN